MNKRIEYIKDSINNNYIGIKFYDTETYKYIHELKEYLGDDVAEEYMSYQKKRDNNSYHMTILNVMEYNNIVGEMNMDKALNYFDNIFRNYIIDDIRLLGIGTAKRNENEAFFIVCKSEKIDKLRETLSLDKKDLHITIGFKYKDVFGIPKDTIITKDTTFLKLLSKQFYKNENFEFVKNLYGYNTLYVDYIIEPIKLNDNWMTLRIFNNKYITISEINGNLQITGQWEDINKHNIIPNSILYKKLKK